MEGAAVHPARRVLVFGWGAAAEVVLHEIALHTSTGVAIVFCISHSAQAGDCDLRDVCGRLGVRCALCDCNKEALTLATGFAPDIIVSASYRKKLPSSILGLCPDSINFHPSLLPKHRGCWSGFWAIFEGDAETGVTCHRMLEEFDEGAILHQERVPILPIDTSVSLYKRLLPVTAACARHVLGLYFAGGLPTGREQTGSASYHFRMLPFDGIIQPEWPADQVDRFIRAMYFPPFDGAAVLINGQRIFVNSFEDYSRLRQEALAAGSSSAAAAGEAVATAAAAA